MSTGVLDRVRRPEYTGENRCLPCTAVNLVIATGASVALGAAWMPLGAAALLVSLLAIYLRGYLVPYTPTLTRRYLPGWMLRWFDKAPAAGDTEEDVEATLRELGAVEECADREDLCLAPDFRSAWRDEVERCRGNLPAAAADLVDAEDADVSVSDGDGTFAARVDGRLAGQWPSRAAFVADAAAAAVLEERDPRWEARGREGRNTLLASLRLFVETCPDCGGAVELGEDSVESCCREVAVAAAECADCGARLFETALPEG